MASEVADQVYAENEGPNKIQDGGQDGMSESLGLNRHVSSLVFSLAISCQFRSLTYICPGPMGGTYTCNAEVMAINLKFVSALYEFLRVVIGPGNLH